MGAREKSHRKLNGDLLKSGDLCMKWRERWMWIYFWELKTNGLRTALIVLQSSTRGFYMPPLKDKRRWNESSAEIASGICPS